jgi:hypothetical protein
LLDILVDLMLSAIFAAIVAAVYLRFKIGKSVKADAIKIFLALFLFTSLRLLALD